MTIFQSHVRLNLSVKVYVCTLAQRSFLNYNP